jgi:putative intracellular protease/amidase
MSGVDNEKPAERPAEKPAERPAVLLAGGRPRDIGGMIRTLSPAFVGIEKPRVAYIGTANGDNRAFFELMKGLLTKAGAKEVVFVRLARERIDIDKAKAALAAADVIFLAGGEVEDGMDWLKKHGLIAYIKELYRQGKQFAGVSAGVIMMGNYWVRWDVEGDDSTASLFDCLDITPLLFDVHGEDEDWNELKTALKLLGDGAKGYGIPRGGAVSADHEGTLINLEKEVLVFLNENGHIRLS